MSVVNEFNAKNVRYSFDPKQVWIIDQQGNRSLFPFDIYCHARPMATKFNFFFNMSSKKLLVVYAERGLFDGADRYQCGIMRFWVDGDSPTPACAWLTNMTDLMDSIFDQFKEQLASFTIDQIINEPDSESV